LEKIHVNASTSYDVLIEKGLLAKAGSIIAGVTRSRRTVIITDDIVDSLYGDILRRSLDKEGFEYSTFVFKNGEQSKCLSVLGRIFDFLAEKEMTRTDSIIALGGGVVGDITGFAAASFLRGMDYVQIPTTLLAQVDSSVGGKTAIDIPGGKNLVGAFKQPAVVICDPETLDSLPEKNFSDGMGEVIKYGMIRDEKLFACLEENDIASLKDIITDIIATCVSIKRDVVEEDEHDTGVRMILNFGHTIGHAIESYYHYETYTHGSAVAMGMCLISAVTADSRITERLKACVKKYKLPVVPEADIREYISICGRDKKRQSSRINFIVCPEIGRAEIRSLPVEEFIKYMEGTNE
jgi:3-dehydroquinate synthase